MTPDTVVWIASMTKAVTGAAAMQQVEQGKLGLDTPAKEVIPGLGDVNWSAFYSALTDVGYQGDVCIEVEDRAYEGPLEARKRSLRQSKRYLEQFM